MCALLRGPVADPAAVLAGFRRDVYRCLIRRADVLFELTDAVLCKDGPVHNLADLTLTPEHRRGHGALYDGLNSGRVDIARLRVVLSGLPLPRMADGNLLSLAGPGPVVGALLAAYLLLIVAIALTAVYSSRPARRRAAITVLRLLLPRRIPPTGSDQPTSLEPSIRRRGHLDSSGEGRAGAPRTRGTAAAVPATTRALPGWRSRLAVSSRRLGQRTLALVITLNLGLLRTGWIP